MLVLGQGAEDNNKSKDGDNNKSKDGDNNKSKDGDKNYTRIGTIRRKSKTVRTQEGGQGQGLNRPGKCVILYMMDGPYHLPFSYLTGCPDRNCPAAS